MRPKVFGIGFQKTGTSSLGGMLTHLGYKVAGYADFRDFADREGLTWSEIEERALTVAKSADAAKDTPWPLLYEHLDSAFPGSKFIHVVRDTESWIKSAVADFGDTPNAIHELIYGVPTPKGHEETWVAKYEQHNRDAAAYFAGRHDDYIRIRLEDGLSYADLCPFLGHPVIEDPKTRTNTRLKKRIKTVFRRFGLKV
jgi:hypothetical protein